jgi:hypothetical protein
MSYVHSTFALAELEAVVAILQKNAKEDKKNPDYEHCP